MTSAPCEAERLKSQVDSIDECRQQSYRQETRDRIVPHGLARLMPKVLNRA